MMTLIAAPIILTVVSLMFLTTQRERHIRTRHHRRQYLMR